MFRGRLLRQRSQLSSDRPSRLAGVVAAISGLVGVLLGGLLTAGVQALFRQQDERRKRRHAARLLREEVIAVIAVAREAEGLPRDWSRTYALLGVWSEQRDALAILTYDEWSAITQLVRTVSVYGENSPRAEASWRYVDETAEAANRVLARYVN
jgi:hypothetical protein